MLVAGIAPKPPVATTLRKTPDNSTRSGSPCVPNASESALVQGESEGVHAGTGIETRESESTRRAAATSHQVRNSGGAASVVVPLSPTTYKLQVTIPESTCEKLRQARDLLRHAIPDGDVAAVLDRALTLLVTDLLKHRCGAVARPLPQSGPPGRTRHISAAVKREVWRRDGGRCAFRGDSQRCSETAFLEFHHVIPYAEGGVATVGNIELRCRAHNQYEATLFSDDGSDSTTEALTSGC